MPEVTNFENIVEGEILDEPEASVWDELTEEEKKNENEEEVKMATTTIDNATQKVISEVHTATKTCASKDEADTICNIADTLEIDYSQAKRDGKIIVTLENIDERQLDALKRKVNIKNWSVATMKVADGITNFMTDVADYALNGAVAPAAVSVANAALTTGRVVGTAGVKVFAGTTASLFRNGRMACREISNSSEIHDCCTEVSKCWSDVSNKLFGIGSNGSCSDGWNVA